ncbi:MAG: ATP-binding protein [Acidobacteriota bacterium]
MLLSVNLVVLLMPLLGIWFLHLYENEVMRRTESELIAQAALVRSLYRDALMTRLAARGPDAIARYGLPLDALTTSGDGEHFHPLVPELDLSKDVPLPRVDDAPPAAEPADPAAVEAGATLGTVFAETQDVTLAGFRVVDPNGVVVATSRSELGGSLASREEVRRALRGEHVSLLRERVSDEPPFPLEGISRSTRIRVFVALPVIAGGRIVGAVIVSRTPMNVAKALYEKRFKLLRWSVSLVLLVGLLTAYTSRTIGRPVRDLIEQTRAVALGAKPRPLAHAGTREIAQLSDAFQRMARELTERSDYIKTFAANVSHEFKTPLTAIQGAVELLRDHGAEMVPDERERFLANIAADAERLTRLVKRLLELARADVATPGGGRSDVAAVLESAAGRARSTGLAVTMAWDAVPQLLVPVGGDVLETIFGNLFENARQHGAGKAEVAVEPDAESVLVRIADDGPGIPAEIASRVFEPFYTTARATGGTGLGLSVVRALLEAHGGAIDLVPGSGGACFSVRLPRDTMQAP